MKERKKDRLKAACILVALALVVFGAGLFLLRLEYSPTRYEIVTERMDDIQANLSFGGRETVLAHDLADAENWLGSAAGNLILLDASGNVLGSANDNFLDGTARLRLLTSPYFRQRETLQGDFIRGALALLLDEGGQIAHRALVIAENMDREPAAAFGRSDTAYPALFPTLNTALHEAYAAYLQNGGAWDDWADWDDDDLMARAEAAAAASFDGQITREEWMNNYDVLQALAGGATQADVDRVKRYCEWEQYQLRQAGDWNARLVQNEDGSLTALALYENNAQTNAAHLRTMRSWELIGNLYPLWLAGLAALILLTALWVFRDARRRNFKPALWGALTLAGNFVALIVYLIVRPAEARCPRCGAAVRPEYAACPLCGAPLKERCAACGRAQEDAWTCCPYCGRPHEGGGDGPPAA